jgi:hypothetical protein
MPSDGRRLSVSGSTHANRERAYDTAMLTLRLPRKPAWAVGICKCEYCGNNDRRRYSGVQKSGVNVPIHLTIVRGLLMAVFAAVISISDSTQALAASDGIVAKVTGLFKDAPPPEEVLSTYLAAQLSGNFAAAYDLLSTADRAFRSKDEYQTDSAKGFAIFGAFAQTTSFKIKNSEIHGLKAAITVENTYPDVIAILGPLVAAALMGGANNAQEKAQKALAEKLASGNFPTATTSSTETLIKEADGWRVYQGLEVRSRAASLLKEGERLLQAKDYGDAQNNFAQVANMPEDVVKIQRDIARERLAETAATAEKEQRKQEYLKRLKLYDLESGLYDTYLDKRVPGVKFKIRNEGDLTLTRVEVTVYFKDASGNTIHEEAFLPVSSVSFGLENHGPLKPGYIWELERGKFYTAKSVPSEWKVGAAEAKITDIDFAK